MTQSGRSSDDLEAPNDGAPQSVIRL
jgi:hypothetical protein